MPVDLNADVGEGMDDLGLMPYLTSASVAGGVHAGNPAVMDATVALALAHGVRVGAHPGYPDRANFGRIQMDLSAAAIEDVVFDQIAALDGIVRRHGARLAHVKPHGALYHAGAKDLDVARAIVAAVVRAGPGLVVVGPPRSRLLEAAREAGLDVAREGFADRRYRADGTLVPRGEPHALLTDPEEAAGQALSVARGHFVVAEDGSRVEIVADTICVHGDTPGAPAIARRIRETLRLAGLSE
jgi:5-oxoprolinase (ATP-hydrolysing) subunit A